MKVAKVLPAGWAASISPDHPRLGLGFDVGTTTKQKSNPSVIALTQEVGMMYFVRLLVCWKTKDPAIARTILNLILDGIPHGLRARRLCIDATSEKYFAVDLRRDFSGRIPVDLIVASEATEYMGEKMIFKQYLGNLLVNTIEDGYVALPKENWVQKDFRSVIRDRGTFEAEVDEDGRHGDCFDAVKLSLHALIIPGGQVQASAAQVGSYSPGRGKMTNRKRPDRSSDSIGTTGLQMP
jgi:phage FluMu gp28-like protein